MTEHVVVGTGTAGSRFLNKDWPITEGLTLGTTKLKEKTQLEADESKIEEKEKVLL